MGGGNGCTTMWMHLMPLNCTFKNIYNGKFCYVYHTTKQKQPSDFPIYLESNPNFASWQARALWPLCTLPPSPSSSVNLFLRTSIQPLVYFLHLTQTHPTSEHSTCCSLFGNCSTHLSTHSQPLILCPAPLAHPVRPTHFPLASLTIWNSSQVSPPHQAPHSYPSAIGTCCTSSVLVPL